MDLNELLHAHQIEVMKASASGDERSRQNHFDKVALYAEQIRRLRNSHRIADLLPLRRSHEAIVEGTRADHTGPKPTAPSLESWEDEGGALYPPPAPLPPGITECEPEKSRADAGGGDLGHD